MRTAALALALLLATGGQEADQTVPKGESPYLYGFHDPGGEQHMLDAGVTGWIVFCDAVMGDPPPIVEKDFTPWSSKGIGVLVRLNWCYKPWGTIPREKLYDECAARFAKYVSLSKGARHWIIANETNLQDEWPQDGGRVEPITVERYVKFYRKVRRAIKSVPGHENDVVIPQATGPWNFQSGDWLIYHRKMLESLGTEVDGIALHTYAFGHDPKLITSDVKTKHGRHKYFRAYIDFLKAVPDQLRDRPVYITETDAVEDWENVDNGWVREAYGEINRWNRQKGTQKIRCLCLFRWTPGGKWSIPGKPEVVEDFKKALKLKYRWDR